MRFNSLTGLWEGEAPKLFMPDDGSLVFAKLKEKKITLPDLFLYDPRSVHANQLFFELDNKLGFFSYSSLQQISSMSLGVEMLCGEEYSQSRKRKDHDAGELLQRLIHRGYKHAVSRRADLYTLELDLNKEIIDYTEIESRGVILSDEVLLNYLNEDANYRKIIAVINPTVNFYREKENAKTLVCA